MKIAFFSNYLSPHQIPFSDAMYRLIGDDYTFVSCSPYNIERTKLGWVPPTKKNYEIRPFESKDDYCKAKQLALESDVMVWGSAKLEFVMDRVRSKKLYVRYSERLFKEGFIKSVTSLDILRHIKFNIMTRSKNSYLFSASSFAPFDYKLSLGHFRKMYRWGYFPETKKYDIDELMSMKSRNNSVNVLWVGRLINLKHPEVAINIGDILKSQNIDFTMNIIGTGLLENSLHAKIIERKLDDRINILGAMSPDKVREYMEKSDIFMFTSDFAEGWGAVLNEAMNSGCTVFCSDAIGSSHYLINDGSNAFLYKNGNIKELADKIINIVNDPAERFRIGKNAYDTIVNKWSAEIAAERFLQWSEDQKTLFNDGPISAANIISPKGGWWKK